MAQATLRQIPSLIAARKPFKGNSMTGEVIDRTDFANSVGVLFSDAGRLNFDEGNRFRADFAHIVYVVRSYATPIAWVLDDGTTYKVGQKFSVTTSKHQGKLYSL